MANLYVIQMMTREDFDRYFMGSYNYSIKTAHIKANSEKAAIAKARKQYGKDFVLNTGYITVIASN